MPIASPIGFLDVVNATLRASQVESTSRLTVANTAATKNFSVGDKFHIDKDSVDPVSVTGNVVASGIKISNLTISPTFDLGAVSNVGNTTANTLQFANATTGFTTTANVEIGGNITLTANAQVKVGSNVLAEYTGPHPRDPKEVPLKKFPEIVFDDGKFEYNADRTVFTQAGYIISQSEKYDSSTNYPAAYLFDDNLLTTASAWVSKYGTFGTGTGTAGEMAATNFSSFNPGTGAINGPWVKIQLPTAIKLSRINIHRWSGSAHNALPGDVTLYGSNNGTTYSQIGSTFTNLYNTLLTINNMNLNVNTTDYYKYYVLHFTSTYQSSINSALYVAVQELKFYGYEEPAPPGDLSLDTTLKSTFNSVRSNNYVMYFDGDGFDPNDANSNNLVTGSSVSVIHHNATYDSTGKYWTLDGSTESNVTTGDLGFEGDVPHTVSMWVNSSNLDANALTQQLFTIGSGYDKALVRVDDTQIAANTWHNVTYAYQGEDGSKVTYVDGRKVKEEQAEDTFGDYPPFDMTDHETGGFRASASNYYSTYYPWTAFDGLRGNGDAWITAGGLYTSGGDGAATSSATEFPVGTGRRGEYLDLEMPYKLKVGYFVIQTRDVNATKVPEDSPHEGYLYGSNDGVNWTEIKFFSGLTYGGASVDSAAEETVSVNSTTAYKHLRLQATKRGGANASDTYVGIGELKYYGHKEGDLTRFPEPTRVLKYPHIAMTGPAQRGYVASASNRNNDDRRAYKAFNNDTSDTNQWRSSDYNDGTYNSTTGDYTGSANLGSDSGGTAFAAADEGEWIKLELPHKIKLQSFSLKPRNSSGGGFTAGDWGQAEFIKTGKLWASIDGTSWINICTITGNSASSLSEVKTFTAGTNFTTPTIFYKYYALVIEETNAGGGTSPTTATGIGEFKLYGTEEDTGTPAIVGGPFAGKVANFRVYDQYLGDERIQEIYDAQKDEFGHKKSSMTFYKGRIGVGTTEPEGALTVVDEPHALAKFPARAVSADDSYVEGDGQIKLSAAEGSGYQAFDGLTSTSWTAAPTRNTRLSEEVDFGAWLKIQTPESVSLKKVEIESNPYWRQVGSEVQGSNANDQLGRAVACSHDGTRVIAGGKNYNNNQGIVQVYDWNGSAWTQVGQNLEGDASSTSPQFGRAVAISGDGNIIAISEPYYDNNGNNKGRYAMYSLVNGSWATFGQTVEGSNTSGYFVGNNAEDNAGYSLKLSYDGKTVAAGHPGYDDLGTDRGRVKVHTYSNDAWSLKGSEIVGDIDSDKLGLELDMSEDGNFLVVSGPGISNSSPKVKVYEYVNSTWTQKGLTLTYTGSDYFGGSVGISNDGNTLAVGIRDADLADGALADEGGLVHVYHWTGSAWGTPHKLTYDEATDGDFGIMLDLSGDGKRLIVGADNEDSDAGELFTFEYTGGSWIRRPPGTIGATGGTIGYLGLGPTGGGGHSIALSRDGSVIVGGELGFDGSAGTNSGRFRVWNMPSNIKSIWGSNDDKNWTKITTAPTREEVTSNVAGLAFGYDDHLEFKNLDNPNYYKYHAIVADAFTRLRDVKLFGVRKQESSTLHDGALTLTKNLDVPRIGPALDADDTPRRDRLVVEYNTSANPLEDGMVRDTSGRGLDGALVGATYLAADKAFTFDGSDYIQGSLTNSSNFTNTVSLWFKMDEQQSTLGSGGTIGNRRTIFEYGPNRNTADGYAFVDIRDTLMTIYMGDSFNLPSSAFAPKQSQWHHFVLMYSGSGTIRVFIDNVEYTSSLTSNSTGTLALPTNTQLLIGSESRLNTAKFIGDISNFKIYDVVLTASEVKTLYDMGRCDEGHHVVNFSKTRVGIGLGDGEAPQATLDVREVATFQNIGIGTTSPQKLLHIKQTADVHQGPGNAIRIEQFDGNGTPEHFDIGIDGDTSGAELYIKSSATTGGFLAVGGDASYVFVPKIFYEDGLSSSPTTISGAVQLIQVNAGTNNGYWQTTARGGMALGAGDDSLLLGCGDRWDEYDTSVTSQDLEDENLRLACDGTIHLHPSLQSGWSTVSYHRFSKNNHYLQDSTSTFDNVYSYYRDYGGSIYKVGAGDESGLAALKLWSDGDIYMIESDQSAYVFRFDVNNDKMYLNGTLLHSSDDRLKFNETRIENATDTLMKLDPQLYDKKRFLDSNILTYEAGFIAQDVWYDVPEFRYMVTLSDDAEPSSERPYTPDDIQVDPDWEGSGWGKKASHLNYEGMIPYIIKSIQEIVTELPLEKNNVLAEGDLSGLIVSTVTGKLTDENKPILTLSNVFCDKACFGVVSDTKPVSRLDPDSLINVNGVGNVWVIYTGSSLTPGDYVTTSNISGYGQLQPDDITRSYTVAKIIQHCDFSEATRQKRIVKQKLADVNYYVKTNYIDITEEEYNSLHEERRVLEEQIYYEYETIHRVKEGEPYDFVKINPEITLEAYEILSSEEKKKYKVRYLKRVIEESPDEPEGHDTFEKKTRNIYKRIVKQYYNTKDRYRELEVRRELVNDLDEHGQLQWEDSGETEKVYKVRYLLPDGTQISEEQYTAKALANEEVYIAAFVRCTYHCG